MVNLFWDGSVIHISVADKASTGASSPTSASADGKRRSCSTRSLGETADTAFAHDEAQQISTKVEEPARTVPKQLHRYQSGLRSVPAPAHCHALRSVSCDAEVVATDFSIWWNEPVSLVLESKGHTGPDLPIIFAQL